MSFQNTFNKNNIKFKTENANVLIVAWGEGCIYPLYNNASANIRVVGKELSLLVKSIRNIFYPKNPNQLKVHCIGHSLGIVTNNIYASITSSIVNFFDKQGAHLCGNAGAEMDFKFDRITGYFIDEYIYE